LLVITLLLFLDSVRTINKIDEDQHEPGSVHSEMNEKISLFRNQRNAFITGFILFLSVVIYRLQHITVDIYQLRKAAKDAAAPQVQKNDRTDANLKVKSDASAKVAAARTDAATKKLE